MDKKAKELHKGLINLGFNHTFDNGWQDVYDSVDFHIAYDTSYQIDMWYKKSKDEWENTGGTCLGYDNPLQQLLDQMKRYNHE